MNEQPRGAYQAAMLRTVHGRRGLIHLWGVKRPDGTWRPGIGGSPQWHIKKSAAEREAAELNAIHGIVLEPTPGEHASGQREE